jgi:hypothetical protein
MDNPFMLTPVEKPEEFIGYTKEKEELENSLSEAGVTLVLSDMGFGKSSLVRVLGHEGKGIYVERCTKDKLYSTLRQHISFLDRLFGKDPTDVVGRPVFLDECAAMVPELASTFNNMHDRGVKLVLSLTHDERGELEGHPVNKTLFDRVTRTIILNGLTKEEVGELIKRRAGDRFSKEALEFISDKFRKPRDVVRICHNLWNEMEKSGKEKVTEDMLGFVLPEIKTGEVVGGGKSQMILDYIKNNPGVKRGEIAKELKMNPNSVTNLLKLLMGKHLVTRTGDFKHYAAGPGSAEGK